MFYQKLQSFDYKPFGDTLNAGEKSRIGYTAQEDVEESRNFAMKARHYDQHSWRFKYSMFYKISKKTGDEEMSRKIKNNCGILFIYSLIIINLLFSCNSNNNPNDEIRSIKQKNKVVFKDTVFIYDSITIDKSNLKAIIEVENKLKIVEKDVDTINNKFSRNQLSQAEDEIFYLVELSKIKIRVRAGYFGRFKINVSEFNLLRDWFEKNKHNLYWDEKEQKVKLKE